MKDLSPELSRLAKDAAARLIGHGHTVAVAESSAGGLLSATLLSVPGASAYFMGGAVVYTRQARGALLGITDAEMKGTKSLGLLGMRERARLLGGTLLIAGTPGQGTTLTVRIPAPQAAAVAT